MMMLIYGIPDSYPVTVVLFWLSNDGSAVAIFLLSTVSIFMMSSMLSSCDITGTLGSISLGGATVIGTLDDGTVIGTLGGVTVVTPLGLTYVLGLSVCCVFMLLNIFANLLIACNCLSLIVKGVLGPGLFIICINSLYALVDCSVVENPGMMSRCGNNSSTWACLSTIMFGLYQV